MKKINELEVALSLFRDSNFVEAINAFENILKRDSQNIMALSFMASSYAKTNKPTEALAFLDKVLSINAADPVIFNNRAITLNDLGMVEDSVGSFKQAIKHNPNYVDAYKNLTVLLNKLNRHQEAVGVLCQGVRLNPDSEVLYLSLAKSYKALLDYKNAVKCFDSAIALNPTNPKNYCDKGAVLFDLSDYQEALSCYNKAIECNPSYASAYNNKGIVLTRLGDFLAALSSYEKAIDCNKHFAEAFNNFAVCLKSLKFFQMALVVIERAIELKPNYHDALWNKSLIQIHLGNYRNGWKLYEERLLKPSTNKNYKNYAKPAWRGNFDITGKRLLICYEQGYGDVIQFCRYIPLLHQYGAEIIFSVPGPLKTILSSLDKSITLIDQESALPDFDAHCPLMSLPYVFGTTLETVPKVVPYLSSNKRKVNQWVKRLGERKNIRVGLVWSSLSKIGKDKSIEVRTLSSLLDLPYEFHSLQVDYYKEEVDYLNNQTNIIQHQELIKDFSDTAALIECMDFVISVDTSVAHLSGALGKLTYLLLPYQGDYRWLKDRVDTPWYPTMSIYQQEQRNNWSEVIDRLTNHLKLKN